MDQADADVECRRFALYASQDGGKSLLPGLENSSHSEQLAHAEHEAVGEGD